MLIAGSITGVTRKAFSDLIATPDAYQAGCDGGYGPTHRESLVSVRLLHAPSRRGTTLKGAGRVYGVWNRVC